MYTSAWHLTPGCSLTDLTSTNAVRQCADRGFVNTLPIPSGVVCYNRTPRSEVVYICDEGFHQDGAATRVCQSGRVWNGSLPQCLPDQGGQDGKYLLCQFIIIWINCISKHSLEHFLTMHALLYIDQRKE